MTAGDLADRIAKELMRQLKSGEIDRINISTIREACRDEGHPQLANIVCRRVVEMV